MPQKLLQVLANTLAIIKISSLFIINPPLTMLHTNIVSYVWPNTYISTIPPIFWLINNKSSGNCRNFIICILHIVSMYSHIQMVHIVCPIGIKTNGNYQNFIIFTCFICSIMCYEYSNTKTYTTSPLVWLIGCKYQGNYRNFDNFPSIICRLVKSVKPSL